MLAVVPILFFTVSLGQPGPTGQAAGATGDASRLEASIDWSGVSDPTIQRCGLKGLQAMLLQLLVEEQLAVVDQPGPGGILLLLSESGARIIIQARSGELEQSARIRVGRRCEGSIILDLQREVRTVVRKLIREMDRSAPPPPPADPRPAARIESPWREAHVAVGTELRSFSNPLMTVLLGSHWALGDSGLQVGALLQTNLLFGTSTAVEPGLMAQVRYRILRSNPVQVSFGPAAGLFAHWLFRDGESDWNLDGALGMPVSVAILPARVVLAVSPVFRFRPVEHRNAGNPVYELGRWGAWITLGYQLTEGAGETLASVDHL